jgi:hypothetical protein
MSYEGGVEVEGTDEFDTWFQGLDQDLANRVAARVDELAAQGTALRFPLSSRIKGSKEVAHMRELRLNQPPIRILYAFDPRRAAILLLAGDKTGDARWYDARWYDWAVPRAEGLYLEHLETLKEEGLL